MRAILAGIGSFGAYWYQTLKQKYPHISLAVVDHNPAAAQRLTDPTDRFYTDLSAALDVEHPDFIINVTPPGVHTSVNFLAFDRRIPVLCEKPIAEDYAEACRVVERADKEGIPFMIAENYRRWPIFRLARSLIAQGELGELTALYVHFFRETYFEKEYLVRMPQPTLVDVTVHHLDLVRYLCAAEGKRIFARSFNPRGSRYPGDASIDILIEMDNGVQVAYNGSLAGNAQDTTWGGDWRIQASRGLLLVTADTLRLVSAGATREISDFSGLPSDGCLDEFLAALSAGRESETSGADYIKTMRLVHYARESLQSGRMLEII
jgi:predicted dehydrogenase